MKIFTLLSVLLTSLFSFSQEHNGYYITNGGQRVEGAFKESDFRNPETLLFKSASASEYARLEASNIAEYGIGTAYKFLKRTVSIDDSSQSNTNISGTKAPNLVSRTVFLEVLVEGDASLYAYTGKEGVKFLYSESNKNIPVTQLVFKKYRSSSTSESENNQYKQQLFNDIKCEGETIDKFLKLSYQRAQLVEVFKNYNQCKGYSATVLESSAALNTKIKYTVFAGAAQSTFGYESQFQVPEDETTTTFTGGIEAALLLPLSKWSFFVKADYEHLSAEGSTTAVVSAGSNKITNTYKVEGNVVNFHIGPRYTFMLSQNNKLFVDAALALSVPVTGYFDYSGLVVNNAGSFDSANIKYELRSTAFFNIGVGYMYNDKFGIDFRVDTNRNYFNSGKTEISAKSSKLGISLRYTLN
jgi:hypothetical protein